MKRAIVGLFILWLVMMTASVWAQEIPSVEYTWTEGDGVVAIPAADLEQFGQMAGRYEVDWTPGLIYTTGTSQKILDVPNHLGLWVWNDGIHGEWYDDTGTVRVFRTRWGLPAVGVEVKIVVTWGATGYAVIVDGVLRIHDWQTAPTTVFPDPDVVSGVYGGAEDGTMPASGAFALRVYDFAQSYNSCTVDTVGTINENVPLDNTGSWSQGINPDCGPVEPPTGTGSATLSWTPATENDDGTAYTDPDGVKIYYGTVQSGQYANLVDITDPTVTSYEITDLPYATYFFAATSYNVEGVESVYSAEVVKVIEAPSSVPNPPTTLTVQEDQLFAYTYAQSTDVISTYAVGTVLAGTVCDTSMSVNGLYRVDISSVIFVQGAQATITFAVCG